MCQDRIYPHLSAVSCHITFSGLDKTASTTSTFLTAGLCPTSFSEHSGIAEAGQTAGQEGEPLGAAASTPLMWAKVEKFNTRGAQNEVEMNHDPVQQLLEACSDWDNPNHPISVKLRYTVMKLLTDNLLH